jgi:hypothetical protein
MTRKGTGAPPDLGFRTKWQQAISMITLPGGTKLTCAEAVNRLAKDKRR